MVHTTTPSPIWVSITRRSAPGSDPTRRGSASRWKDEQVSDRPLSAARLAEQLGPLLPELGSIPPEAFELVIQTRALVEAVVLTDVDAPARAAAARAISAITDDLLARHRPEPLLLVRRDERGVESLLQAGSGRLNPQAPPVEWLERRIEPDPGTGPVPSTVRARCVFGAAHAGSPSRVHGGVLALVLDDPDARPILASRGIKASSFLHWIAADIDPSTGGLPANASVDAHAFVQGKNGGGKIGYRGPQPPADFPPNTGKRLIHIYRLTLYALSSPTGLADGFSLDELRAAIRGKVLGEARLNISYSND